MGEKNAKLFRSLAARHFRSPRDRTKSYDPNKANARYWRDRWLKLNARQRGQVRKEWSRLVG